MDLPAAEQITVAFEGPGAGRGPLSWGQIERALLEHLERVAVQAAVRAPR
ncbi:hypothetical protein AB0H83_17425 [Dactylosporangium sp. NPDC050688]